MTVLIRGPKVLGQRRQSCNARCYNARKPACVCICGGGNHGAGEHQAHKNTQAVAEELIEKGAEVIFNYSLM